MKITRRKLAAALLIPAAATPAQSPAAATPAEELTAARKRVQDAIEAVRQVRLNAEVEPDFSFRA